MSHRIQSFVWLYCYHCIMDISWRKLGLGDERMVGIIFYNIPINEVSGYTLIQTRHQRMHVPTWGIIRENGNTSMGPRGAKLSLCGKNIVLFLKTHQIKMHTKNKKKKGWVDSLAGGGWKQLFSPDFINFLGTRGPKFGQCVPKAN